MEPLWRTFLGIKSWLPSSAECGIKKTHIHQLRHETIKDILEYLHVEDQKSASLVCRLWSQEAFSTCQQSSFWLRIDCRKMKDWDRVVSVLQNSRRSYHELRKLHVIFDYKGCQDRHSTYVTAILDMIGSEIDELIITGICPWTQLSKFLTKTPNLKRLNVDIKEEDNPPPATELMQLPVLAKLYDLGRIHCKNHTVETEQFDVLHVAPNVQKLEMFISSWYSERSLEILRRYAPQLRSINLQAVWLFPIDELQFKQLEELFFHGDSYENDNTMLCKLFHKLPLLKVLRLPGIAMCRSLLEIICTNCPLLNTLDIKMNKSEERCFQCLEKLTDLQYLGNVRLSLDVMKDCKPLMSVIKIGFYTYLESIDLAEAFVHLLHEVLPNLRTIKLYFRDNQDSVVEQFLVQRICQKFVHLRILALVGFFKPNQYRTLELPDGLGNVEELSIFGGGIGYVLPPLNNVRHLQLEEFDPVDFKLHRIDEIFPNLRSLNVLYCKHIDQHMLADVRRRIPDCVIKYKPWNLEFEAIMPYIALSV